jgi:hypothetical protein
MFPKPDTKQDKASPQEVVHCKPPW